MTREQIMERQPIFNGLAELYEKATHNKIEVFYNATVVYAGDSYDTAKRFTNDTELIEFILTGLHDYMLGIEK